MAQTNLSIRIDEDLKKAFDRLCSDIGMSVTTAFCIFAKKAVKEQKIPFELTGDPFFSEKNIKRLEHSISQIEKTGGTIHDVNLDD